MVGAQAGPLETAAGLSVTIIKVFLIFLIERIDDLGVAELEYDEYNALSIPNMAPEIRDDHGAE